MIVATAGHIDHGKTALIKALTGVDADRLPEEKRRGITVDLGFAFRRTDLGDVLSFVDVPGHEKLVHTMLAGASGVDFVLLVVAADDGVMPQTREHLAIVDLLGLSRGIVAITKIDKVDATRVGVVAAEVQAMIDGTVLAAAPILPVSAHTRDGLAELDTMLAEAAATAADRGSDGGFRLAVDRAFSLAGAGLVVTGTVHAGRVAKGDRLLLAPGGSASRNEIRVRGLHAANAEAEVGTIGQRCALNITGPRVDKATVTRGDWIIAPALPEQTGRIDVALRLLSTEPKALRHWTPVHVHIGSADVMGRVALLEDASLAPGKTALAQLVLDQTTSVIFGDRFVIRDQSARRTIGGGHVIDPQAPTRNVRRPERLATLRAFDHHDHATALAQLLATAPQGVNLDHFKSARNISRTRSDGLVAMSGAVQVASGGKTLLIAPAVWAGLRAQVIAAFAAHGHRHSDSFGVTATEILRSTNPAKRPALTAALDSLVAEKTIVRFGQLLQVAGHVVELQADEEERWEAIERMLIEADIDPPRIATIAERLRETDDELTPFLEKLGRMGKLQRVSKAYFILPEVLARLAERANGCAEAHEHNILTVGRFRDATGISRHASMPVLEFFDRIGFTGRHQDGRRIRTSTGALFNLAPKPHPGRSAAQFGDGDD